MFRQFLRNPAALGNGTTDVDFGEDNAGPEEVYGHDRPDPGMAPVGSRGGAYTWPKKAKPGETPSGLQELLADKDIAMRLKPFSSPVEHGKTVGCGFIWEDSPRVSLTFADDPGAHRDLWLDFLGVVYDRCNQWKIVDQRRMQLWARVARSEEPTGENEYPLDVDQSSCAVSEPGKPGEPNDAWTNSEDSTQDRMHGTKIDPDQVQECR